MQAYTVILQQLQSSAQNIVSGGERLKWGTRNPPVVL